MEDTGQRTPTAAVHAWTHLCKDGVNLRRRDKVPLSADCLSTLGGIEATDGIRMHLTHELRHRDRPATELYTTRDILSAIIQWPTPIVLKPSDATLSVHESDIQAVGHQHRNRLWAQKNDYVHDD
jgi:hypothetical protein